METPKEKILKYLKSKGISQDKFARDCGVSGAFLRQGKSFSIDILPKIRNNYIDLNLNWLIYNEGNMLLDEQNTLNESVNTYKKEPSIAEILHKEFENCKRLVEAKNETIQILKHQLGINGDGTSKAG